MKKKLLTNSLRILLICLSFLTVRCNKKNEVPATDPATLSNQLVCKVNGNEWKSTEVLYSGFYDYSPAFNRRYLFLHYVGGGQDINIFINPPYNKGTYILNKNTLNYPATSYPENYVSFEPYHPDMTPENICVTGSISTGKVEFTVLDSTRQVVKGKLSFTGRDKQTGKVVSITEGYFDFHQ